MVGTHRHRHRLGDRRAPARRAHRRAACAGPGSTRPTCRARASSTSTRSSRCRTPRPRSRRPTPAAPASGASPSRTTPRRPSDADARWADVAVASSARDPPNRPPAQPTASAADPASATLWSSSPAFPSRALDRAEARRRGPARRPHRRRDRDDGTALAWTVRGGQLVTPAKELSVLRPHGHLLRTGDTFTPDSRSLASTVWMAGTFHSQITRGHVGRNPVVDQAPHLPRPPARPRRQAFRRGRRRLVVAPRDPERVVHGARPLHVVVCRTRRVPCSP